MADIYLGLLLITFLAAALFVAAMQLSKSVSKKVCDVIAVIFVVFTVFYIWGLRDNLILAELLPVSNLIVIGNWSPLMVSFVAGLAWTRIPGGNLRKLIPVLALIFTGFYSAVSPLVGDAPRCGYAWDEEGICRQTTNHTCTSASAATLLEMHEIHATEQEMADLCFTREGTTWQGLFRGLKKKTLNSKWDVEVFTGNIDQLRQQTNGPIALSVGLEKNFTADANYESELGWIPGMGHTVLLLGFTEDGRAIIADPSPSVGRELWTTEQLRILWRGYGMRLVKRLH